MPRRVLGWGRWVLSAIALAAASFVVSGQGITVPNTFVNGTVADAPQVNANFAALAAGALNRNGGTMVGPLSSQSVAPTADTTYDLGSASFAYRDAYVKRNTILNTVTYTWPGAQGAAGRVLQNDGSGTLSWTGGWTVVTTTATGQQNDFAPGLLGNTVIRCNNATLLTISGFGGGAYDGQHVKFISVGAGQVDFPHQSTNSTTTNRMINFATSAATSLAAGVGTGEFVYDGTTGRWRMVAHEQGQPITATFAAGNFTGNGAMTWTVAGGNVATMSYYLKGRRLTIDFYIASTTVGGTVNTLLQIGNAAWGGYTAQKSTATGFAYIDNGGSQSAGTAQITSATLLQLLKNAVATWTLSTTATTVGGQISVEVL